MFLACSVFFSHAKSENDYVTELPFVTASSEKDGYPASNAHKVWQLDGWVAGVFSSNEWIQSNMPDSPKVVVQIVLHDAKYEGEKYGWVSSFAATYFDVKDNEQRYINPQSGTGLFPGVSNYGAPRRVSVEPHLVYRLRIYPKTFFNQATLRYQLLFCARELG